MAKRIPPLQFTTALKCACRWVPQVWFLNLGLGVDSSLRGVGDAGGTATLLRERRATFHHLQLLPAVAVAQAREGERCVCTGTGEASRRTGISTGGVRGDAGARTFAGERAAKRNTFDGAA